MWCGPSHADVTLLMFLTSAHINIFAISIVTVLTVKGSFRYVTHGYNNLLYPSGVPWGAPRVAFTTILQVYGVFYCTGYSIRQ